MPISSLKQKEEATLNAQLSFSIKDPKRLFSMANILIDPILATIAKRPRFCLNNAQQVRLIDEDNVEGMQASLKDNLALINTIDNSGPTGIGYIITTLPDNRDESDKAGDEVLKAWHAKFPMDRYIATQAERSKQLLLYYHELWLDKVDRFFDQCAWKALPEEVHQIFSLEEKLEECEDELSELPEDVDNLAEKIAEFDRERDALIARREEIYQQQLQVNREKNLSPVPEENEEEQENASSNPEIIIDINTDSESEEDELNEDMVAPSLSPLEEINASLAALEKRKCSCIKIAADHAKLRAKIEQIQAQLNSTRAIRDALDVNEVKPRALMQAHLTLTIALADRTQWCVLLNFAQNDPARVITEAQFTSLVFQAVDALAARRYVLLLEEELGPLGKQLISLREMQNEVRSNAEGSSRTRVTAKGDIQRLSNTQVRDPINRTLFIDVAQSTDGSQFRDLFIGACLWIMEHPPLIPNPPNALPEVIQEFIDEELKTDPTYIERAKDIFKQFNRNSLVLPPEQMTALAECGLHPAPAALSIPIAHYPFDKMGFFARSKSVDFVSEGHNFEEKEPFEPWSA